MSITGVTIFVRHKEGCKYAGDELSKRCNCAKHMRWTHDGKQYRKSANTRSWAEAERNKRPIEDQLAGRLVDAAQDGPKSVADAVRIFRQDKAVQGLTSNVMGKYKRELFRLQTYCERSGVFTVQGITREVVTGFMGTWESHYASSQTRSKVRERLRSFLRYAYDVQWIPRVPQTPKVKVDEPPTMPLTADEFARLLAATSEVVLRPAQRARVRSLFLLMRYSGLAIRDALTLERAEIQKGDGFYRVTTSRQKTGVHVSVPIPAAIAEEILAVKNDNPRFVFWSGNGNPESIVKNYTKNHVRPAFVAAKLDTGHMKSHRLRDTFAVDLLEKGVPLEEVSKLLGHESIRTTEKSYAKWVKARQDRLNALVIGTWEAA